MVVKVGVALIAVSAVVAGSIALAGSNSKLPGKEESFSYRPGSAVTAPAAAARLGTLAPRRATQTRVKYVESNTFAIDAAGRDDFFMRCPRRYGAINGYLASEGGIVSDYSAVGRSSLRRWDFGLINIGSDQASYFTGLVCIKP